MVPSLDQEKELWRGGPKRVDCCGSLCAWNDLVSCPINNVAFAVGQLAVFQGVSEVPISGSYGSIRRGGGKTANWPRPGGLR
jgi:hypothetical protein